VPLPEQEAQERTRRTERAFIGIAPEMEGS